MDDEVRTDNEEVEAGSVGDDEWGIEGEGGEAGGDGGDIDWGDDDDGVEADVEGDGWGDWVDDAVELDTVPESNESPMQKYIVPLPHEQVRSLKAAMVGSVAEDLCVSGAEAEALLRFWKWNKGGLVAAWLASPSTVRLRAGVSDPNVLKKGKVTGCMLHLGKCTSGQDQEGSIQIACGHTFCPRCLATICQAATREKNVLFLRCPGARQNPKPNKKHKKRKEKAPTSPSQTQCQELLPAKVVRAVLSLPWTCGRCTCHNAAALVTCSACSCPRDPADLSLVPKFSAPKTKDSSSRPDFSAVSSTLIVDKRKRGILSSLKGFFGNPASSVASSGSTASISAPTSLPREPILSRYKDTMMRSFVGLHPHFTACPTCAAIAYFDEGGSATVDCSCGRSFCFQCGQASHPPLPCDLLRDFNDRRGINSFLQKSCPRCTMHISHSQSAPHRVHCRECETDICFICLRLWSEHPHPVGIEGCYFLPQRSQVRVQLQALVEAVHTVEREVNKRKRIAALLNDLRRKQGGYEADLRGAIITLHETLHAARVAAFTTCTLYYLAPGNFKTLLTESLKEIDDDLQHQQLALTNWQTSEDRHAPVRVGSVEAEAELKRRRVQLRRKIEGIVSRTKPTAPEFNALFAMPAWEDAVMGFSPAQKSAFLIGLRPSPTAVRQNTIYTHLAADALYDRNLLGMIFEFGAPARSPERYSVGVSKSQPPGYLPVSRSLVKDELAATLVSEVYVQGGLRCLSDFTWDQSLAVSDGVLRLAHGDVLAVRRLHPPGQDDQEADHGQQNLRGYRGGAKLPSTAVFAREAYAVAQTRLAVVRADAPLRPNKSRAAAAPRCTGLNAVELAWPKGEGYDSEEEVAADSDSDEGDSDDDDAITPKRPKHIGPYQFFVDDRVMPTLGPVQVAQHPQLARQQSSQYVSLYPQTASYPQQAWAESEDLLAALRSCSVQFAPPGTVYGPKLWYRKEEAHRPQSGFHNVSVGATPAGAGAGAARAGAGAGAARAGADGAAALNLLDTGTPNSGSTTPSSSSSSSSPPSASSPPSSSHTGKDSDK